MRKQIIIFTFVVLSSIVSHNVYAVSAVPWPVEKTQPDGTKITVRLCGDERVHWMESEDGYTLLYGADRFIVYAEQDGDGNLVPSQRQFSITSLPQSVSKGLRYSEAQVSAMRSRVQAAQEKPVQKAFLGQKKVLAVLVDFSNRSMVKDRSDFDALMNQIGYNRDGAKGSVKDFYLENSYGQLELDVTVVGPYTAPNTCEYYGNESRWQEFAAFAINAADADVDFTEFAVNGAVETFHIIFAGYGDESIGNGKQIWSHQSSISSVVKDGVRLARYSCSPELRGGGGSNLTYIGVIAHELGHVFGSPDYYDISANGGGINFVGTGKWDLMANGSWNDGGRQPAHINPYQKIQYGWITPITLEFGATITDMPASATSPVIYKIPAGSTGEHYLLENKQFTGFDSSLPGHGLLIWHAAATIGSEPNDNPPLQFYPVCAASSNALPGNTPDTYGYINGDGTPFPGTSLNSAFTDISVPQAFSWSTMQGIKRPVTNIVEADNKISFEFMRIADATVNNLQASVNGQSVVLTWEKPTNTEVIGYEIYRDGSLVYSINSPSTLSFTDINVLNGDHSYRVVALYSYINSEPVATTVTVTEGSDDACLSVSDLTAESCSYEISLDWSPSPSGWIGFSRHFSEALDGGSEKEIFQGIRYNPEDLKGLDAYKISKIKFVPHDPQAEYTVVVYKILINGANPALSYSQKIPSYALSYGDEYNEVTLTGYVSIKATQSLIVGILTHSYGNDYISVDNGISCQGRNVIKDENGWTTFEDYGIPSGKNLCLGIYLEKPGSTSDNPDITKYEIYRNGEKVGESDTNSFQDRGLTPETMYSYCISAVYSDGRKSEAVCMETTTKSTSECATEIVIPAAGAKNSSLTVFPNPVAAGEPFRVICNSKLPIRIFSINGQLIKQQTPADNSTELSIGAPGIYLISSGNQSVRIEVKTP